MSKYNDLKSSNIDAIEGKHKNYYSDFLHYRNGGVTVIRGYPACPECQTFLSKDYLGAKWFCTECGTVWTTAELVHAIKSEPMPRQVVSIRDFK